MSAFWHGDVSVVSVTDRDEKNAHASILVGFPGTTQQVRCRIPPASFEAWKAKEGKRVTLAMFDPADPE